MKKILFNPWEKKPADYISIFDQDVKSNPSPYSEILIPTILDEVKSIYKSQNKIIDIGCGEGYLTRQLFDKNYNITGSDLSSEMVERAFLKNKNIKYCVQNLESKKLNIKEKYDIATSNLVFQYISNIDQALLNTNKILNKSGYFIITMSHPCFYLAENNNWFVSDTNNPYVAGNYFTKNKMFEKNISKGFKTFHIHRTISEYIHHFQKNNFSIIKTIEPKFTDKTQNIILNKTKTIPFFLIFVLQKTN